MPMLGTIADLLDDEVLPVVPAALQHKVRVAGNLARILKREVDLAGDAVKRERDLLAGLLGHDGEFGALRAELTRRLRSGEETSFECEAWQTLVTVACEDLAIAKPGPDSWEG